MHNHDIEEIYDLIDSARPYQINLPYFYNHNQKHPALELFNISLNPLCGDQVAFYIHNDSDIQFATKSCLICQASCAACCLLFKKTNFLHNLNKAHQFFIATPIPEKENDYEHNSELSDFVLIKQFISQPARIKCATLPIINILDYYANLSKNTTL